MENKKKSKQKSTVSMFIYLLSSIKEHNWTFCLAVSTCLHSANLGEYHWTKLISVKWNTLNEFKYLLSQMERVIYVHTVKKTFKSAFKIMTTAGSWQDLALLFPHWILLKKKKKKVLIGYISNFKVWTDKLCKSSQNHPLHMTNNTLKITVFSFLPFSLLLPCKLGCQTRKSLFTVACTLCQYIASYL